jgi:alpha-tubulin suppressor-like RCC1 family protein
MPFPEVCAGAGHTACLLRSSAASEPPTANSLYTWGQGEDGQLGHHDSEDIYRPKEVADLADVELATVSCGAHHTIAVTAAPKREVYAWGWGDFGRLGNGDPGDRLAPTPITALSGIPVLHVACGDSHCLVVAVDGKLYSFGRNQNGQLGLGDTEDRLTPCLVRSLVDRGARVRRAAGGAEHSAITAVGGTMFTFGWGRYGNLGHGHARDLHVPTLVESLEGQNVTDPICGWRHSAALTNTGRLWTFGWSKYGQLGHGDTADHWTPKRLPEFAGGPITSASGGWRHMCALAGSTGTLYAWGWNHFGQLGDGSREDAHSPREISVGNGEAVKTVACGWRHTVAVAGAEDEVYTWGRCVNGQLGHGNTAQRETPTKVQALNLLRQGIEPVVGSDSQTGVAKRARNEQDDMRVPSVGSNKKPHAEDGDFAAVPDA